MGLTGDGGIEREAILIGRECFRKNVRPGEPQVLEGQRSAPGFRPEGNAVANGGRSQAVDGVGGLQVEPRVLRVEDEPPVTGEPSKEASSQAIQQVFEALPGWRANAMETRPAVLPGVGAVEHQHVQMHVQRAGLMTMVILVVLAIPGIPLTAFAFVSGAIAIGVGFGAQNIINNFISAWILMGERPIRIGDNIGLDDVRGRVEAINNRSARIRRTDGVHLLVPSSALLETTVVNWTLVDDRSRSNVAVGVAYGSPVRRDHELMLEVCRQHPEVVGEPEPEVFFQDFGDSALIFEDYFWLHATSERGRRGVRSDIRFAIDEVFAEHGIVIAFPQRHLHVDGSLLLRRS